MKIKNVNIKGLKIIKTKMFFDKRGFFKEIFKNNLIKKDFKFDVMSLSRKNVIRGLHIQIKRPQAKVITVVYGKIMDVAVDLRVHSPTFGKYFSIIMSFNDDFSFYIPKNFAHGFLCLSNNCTINPLPLDIPRSVLTVIVEIISFINIISSLMIRIA